MGLLAPIILGALLIIAFALTSQQKLAIASLGGPMPARQIAYLMRVHHQSAIKQQLAAPSPGEEVDLAPPTMAINENLFVSCLYGKIVATGIFTSGTGAAILSPADANAVVAELKRQTIYRRNSACRAQSLGRSDMAERPHRSSWPPPRGSA